MKLPDRLSAARLLAERIATASPELPPPTLVMSVGDEARDQAEAVATTLGLPLGHYGVAELTLPWRPALAFGAITDDNHHHIDQEIASDHSVGAREIAQIARALLPALRHRRTQRPDVKNAQVLVFAESLTTGYRCLAVAASLAALGAAGVHVASPCAARDALARVAAAGHPVYTLVVSDGPLFHGPSFYAR